MQDNNTILRIKPRSAIYKDEYITRILIREEKTWIIAMPEVKGKFIPLPVGTVLRVDYLNENKPSFQSEVIERNFRGGRYLTITAPGTISRGGRDAAKKRSKVIAFSSGKGGVGKSTMIINTALALQSLGKQSCLIDVDLGTANVDILLKIDATYNLYHILEGEKSIEEIVVHTPEGLLLVPGGSGLEKLANLSEWQFSRLLSAFNNLEDMADYLLLDTGTGVSRNVTNFLLAADEVVLVAAPDPHAVMDAYALIKVLANSDFRSNIKLIVNKADKEEAHQVWYTLSNASMKFLNLPIEYLGFVPFSKTIALSIKKQKPFFVYNRNDKTIANILKIAELLANIPAEKRKAGLSNFIHKLKDTFAGTN